MKSAEQQSSTAVLAATFSDREQAHDAARILKDEGFDQVWIGLVKREDTSYNVPKEVTWPNSQRVISQSAKIEADNWFQRVFGEGNASLQKALLDHGVTEQDAANIHITDIESVILTVDSRFAPDQALAIIESEGGRILPKRFRNHYDSVNTYRSQDREPPDQMETREVSHTMR